MAETTKRLPSAAPAGERVPLLPCPFCGKTDDEPWGVGIAATQSDDPDVNDDLPDGERYWTVLCPGCGASCSLYCRSEADAIAAWNRRPQRPPAPSAAPEVAALADRLEALAKKATPDPWKIDEDEEPGFVVAPGGGYIAQFGGPAPDWVFNSELAVELRNNLPTILAALRSAPDGWTAGCEAMREAAARALTIYLANDKDFVGSVTEACAVIRSVPLPPPPAKAPRDEGGGE